MIKIGQKCRDSVWRVLEKTYVDNFCDFRKKFLQYLLKVRYITVVDANEAGFLISYIVFMLWDGNTALCLKNTSKKWEAFAFDIAHIVTKLSQNMYLINKHILIYRYAKCDCKLWSALQICCVF